MRSYWLRFYLEIYLKLDSHKTQRHKGELKAKGKSYFGASIHFSLMIEIKVLRWVPRFQIKTDQKWLWYFYSSSIILGSPENDIQQIKSLCQMSVKQSTVTCWSANFLKKLNRSGNAHFFPVKSFSKTDSTLISFFFFLNRK